mgnify:CR=1 FL=1|jgi:hypothetical protein
MDFARLRLGALEVGVVGCGRMGCAMAGELARRGCSVTMYDHTDFTRLRALQTLQASLTDHIDRGLLLPVDSAGIMGRVSVAETLEDAVARAKIIFEAVLDELPLKRELFGKMGACPDGKVKVLTTNTINLDVREIAQGTNVTVHGCRFLYPVWFIDEVELALGLGENGPSLKPLLESLGFKPSIYSGIRRRLGDAEIQAADEAQRKDVERRRRMTPAMSAPDGKPPDAGAQSTSGPPCSVCLDAPRSALLVPCGHTSTCMNCAKKLNPPICVECRQPIEKLLPWLPSAQQAWLRSTAQA